MTLVRWEPFRGTNSLRREMDRFWNGFNGLSIHAERSNQNMPTHMALDIAETDEEIIVTAEMPGINEKDIDVTVEGDNLTIKGEKKAAAEEEGKRFHRVERCYGSFGRSIRLPSDVKLDSTKASFKDGVLQVVLPKSEEEKPRKIDVN